MSLIFKNRHGFLDNQQNKFVGYLYEDINSGRLFSISNKVNTKIFYINEIDDDFRPEDNVYSVLDARSLNDSKRIIRDILKGKK